MPTPHLVRCKISVMLKEMIVIRALQAKDLICLGNEKNKKNTQCFQLVIKPEILISYFNLFTVGC